MLLKTYTDKKKRKIYQDNHISSLAYKSMFINEWIHPSFRCESRYHFLNNSKKYSSNNKHKSRCLVTGRSRNVHSLFKISRFTLKNMIHRGEINLFSLKYN